MNFMIPSFQISASGLEAQRVRMDLASSNLANAQTTRGPDGKAYQKLRPIFHTAPVDGGSTFETAMDQELKKVEVAGIDRDETPPREIFDPGHPDANEKGFVSVPNINLMEEMADMLLATRAYEANVTAFNVSKSMAMSALNLGKF